MAATTIAKQAIYPEYDWAKQVKEFEDTKAGVKGLGGGAAQRREAVVEGIWTAAAEWGFFRVVNHGVLSEVMEGMLEAVRRFHEQKSEDKAEYYSADSMQRVRFTNNLPGREFDAANWKDILFCFFHDDYLDRQAIPLVCRKELQEYVKCMIKLRETMAELLSEALGLSSHYLSRMECMKSELLASLYYPICPEPHLTLGTPRHSDINFLTLLLQDNIGGLQVRHKNQWVDVPPLPGTLIANIGDLMQEHSLETFNCQLYKMSGYIGLQYLHK
ncbi:hypothetical protein Vadar_001487 [Vaccinium darrowii]|uniref:Uncharacterized protein n=1 Tax=Vaccinium darrowii TaxID=229202 RepID=A0ACB7XEP2_9ERIC|nr:hypothetical protein Vadar_001487 [Vaccinium darrowii]